ncbi:MAG TPA: hypothetical protein PKV67_15365 [Hyphomonas sp.]|nr:hypothetical protein [Hyphomonas sp.]HRJ02127.1 hypothetical protein [Hyphomonas sp.]HRK68241.1 hypothetical protein [Hyphomonas sp.]
MSLLSSLFGKKPAKVALKRLEKVVSAEPDSARPIRAITYREAYVVYESGYRRKGVVMDHADNGVRLRFPSNERLPPVVTLNARAIGLEGTADVVWQNNSEAGLRLRS